MNYCKNYEENIRPEKGQRTRKVLQRGIDETIQRPAAVFSSPLN